MGAPDPDLGIEQLWHDVGFRPNVQQETAIRHVDGPLYLPAGPGSGKTRVLLWRTLNLIVCHGVPPESIFLSTFTEKAAAQLRDGLRTLLAHVTNRTGRPFDLGKMYVGTVHSLCQRILLDRRFYLDRQRSSALRILDELDQYLFIARTRVWGELLAVAGFDDGGIGEINAYFGTPSLSKYRAVTYCIQFFNRLSEEFIDTELARESADDPTMQRLLRMYDHYRDLLSRAVPQATDFAVLQQRAYVLIKSTATAPRFFRHIVVDEYQDTNAIQERIFFRLASASRNLCIVGDDDQALYRFRGATVENFVEFPTRCERELGLLPRTIVLATNYRSRRQIVEFSNGFMTHCDWRKSPAGSYRVEDKRIVADSRDDDVSVVASSPTNPDAVSAEIAATVRGLIDQRLVDNPNQVAFLYPSLKTPHAARMIDALAAVGLTAYAPRAARFVECAEATDVLGVFLHVFGRPGRGDFPGADYSNFHDWLDRALAIGDALMRDDARLAKFVVDRRRDLQVAESDYAQLTAVIQARGWAMTDAYDIAKMKRALYSIPALSDRAKRTIASQYFERIVAARIEAGHPMPLDYVLKRATSVDWSILDLFYRVCGFDHFRAAFHLAQRVPDVDEGPICNLGLVSQYIGRFMDSRAPIITGALLQQSGFARLFFGSYVYALFRRAESEYEDADDPFPKGRIPFLTIHQAKGLEFPVVVLANLRKDDRGPQVIERLVRPMTARSSEPLDRLATFDAMRMFYVALSRAKKLLVLAHFAGPGQRVNKPFREMMVADFTRLPAYTARDVLADASPTDEVPRSYSYTGDYLAYRRCPQQYMVFRKYGFVPSRYQTMVFGSLVHRTMDDLHQFLIARRSSS